MTPDEILKLADDENVRFLRLQFTDLTGVLKNVEVPRSQFEKALENQIMFDGSSIDGFTRIEESDMLLYPDLDTFQINPWKSPDGSRVARMICDVHNPDGSGFAGCPRLALKRQVERAEKLGYTMVAGPEAEFFLFQKDDKGNVVLDTHDVGGYFDLTPVDLGEDAAATSSSFSRAWASRSRLRTTKWRPASTRSTSSTPRPLPAPTTW